MEIKSRGEKPSRQFYIVVDDNRILYRSRSRAEALAYQNGWNSPTALVLKIRRVWRSRMQT